MAAPQEGAGATSAAKPLRAAAPADEEVRKPPNENETSVSAAAGTPARFTVSERPSAPVLPAETTSVDVVPPCDHGTLPC